MAEAIKKAIEINPVVQVFERPPTDIALTRYRMTKTKSFSSGIHPLEFIISGVNQFIDLGRSYFEVELVLKKANDTNIVDEDHLYPGQNLIHTMIKQCSVSFNGSLVSKESDTYPYKAWIETVLNNDRLDGETILPMQGFQQNGLDFPTVVVANTFDTTNAAFAGLSASQKSAVRAMMSEKTYYTDGKRRTLFFRPHSEAFQVGKLMVPHMEMHIQFFFNDPKFFLMGVGAQGRLTEADIKMTFHACQVELAPPIRNYLDHVREQGEYAKYPVVTSEIRTYALAGGMTEFNEDKIFQNRIPNLVVVGLLHQNSYNGDYAYNPFAFQQFGLTEIKQLVDGEEYPYKNTLKLNAGDGNKDLVGYQRFLEATGALMKNKPNLLRSQEWGNGKNCTLFVFNNVPTGILDSENMNIKREGNLQIQFKLNAPPGHVIIVLIYAQFEAIMDVTKEGGALYEGTLA